ncbi:MAG: hypothetical protein WBE44_08155 [Terriglobales bacterium]|jgi:hypothetical protein
MATRPPLTEDPKEFLWRWAVRTAAKRKFRFSRECEANLKERLKSGLGIYKVGLYEFRERLEEAEASIEKLIDLTIREEIARDPDSHLLHEPSMFAALYSGKLCSGLWPLC